MLIVVLSKYQQNLSKEEDNDICPYFGKKGGVVVCAIKRG
jgi:hypothetical protein